MRSHIILKWAGLYLWASYQIWNVRTLHFSMFFQIFSKCVRVWAVRKMISGIIIWASTSSTVYVIRTLTVTCWTPGRAWECSACGAWVMAGQCWPRTPTNVSGDTTLRTLRTETCMCQLCCRLCEYIVNNWKKKENHSESELMLPIV